VFLCALHDAHAGPVGRFLESLGFQHPLYHRAGVVPDSLRPFQVIRPGAAR
jgi:hypothetical protein